MIATYCNQRGNSLLPQKEVSNAKNTVAELLKSFYIQGRFATRFAPFRVLMQDEELLIWIKIQWEDAEFGP